MTSHASASAIVTHDLARRFPSGDGLTSLSIDVAHGEVLALLGPNGAGKTTTVRLLNGVLAPDGGTATVLGLDVGRDGHEIRRRTGVLTENAGLDDRLTAFENLWFAARLRGLARADARHRIDNLLERFAMADRRDTPVQGMSTGQRKRLALIRALVHEPDVLFLDEPTSGLDPSATRAVLDLIDELAQAGRTIVLCTHFLAEAGRLADRVAILDRGRLHAFGRPGDLAGQLWPGAGITFDLGRPGDPALVQRLGSLAGVLSVETAPTGAVVRVDDRGRIPSVISNLVEAGVSIYGAAPQQATLEDVYFAVEQGFATLPDPDHVEQAA